MRVLAGLLLSAMLAGCSPEPTHVPAQSGAGPSSSWDEMARAPYGWHDPEGAFWIDDRLVVVAGSTIQSWDPDRDHWAVIARLSQADDCEGCGYGETAVWTGEELLLWGGGFGYRAPDRSVHRGVAVDLNGAVTPLPPAPVKNRWWHGAVWTGSEMIVFGGGNDSHARRDGAAYDPATKTWRVLPRSPVGGYANSLVWTGREMVTWGGIEERASGSAGYPAGFIARGAAYDPRVDRWRRLPRSGIELRGWHTAVWTGHEMIVWGGVARTQTTCYDCGFPNDAGVFEPSTQQWRRIDPGPIPGRVEHTAVWTGSRMIVFGGSAPGGGRGRADGASYDVVTDGWESLSPTPIPGRYRHVGLWNGRAMVVWGGQNPRGGGYRDGALYRPRGI